MEDTTDNEGFPAQPGMAPPATEVAEHTSAVADAPLPSTGDAPDEPTTAVAEETVVNGEPAPADDGANTTTAPTSETPVTDETDAPPTTAGPEDGGEGDVPGGDVTPTTDEQPADDKDEAPATKKTPKAKPKSKRTKKADADK